MKTETTLILVKPDAVADGLTGEVLRRFEKEGLRILNCRMLRLTLALLKEHYAHLAHLPFFPGIEKFMASGPVVAAALQGPKAIERVRELLGRPTAPRPPRAPSGGTWGRIRCITWSTPPTPPKPPRPS